MNLLNAGKKSWRVAGGKRLHVFSQMTSLYLASSCRHFMCVCFYVCVCVCVVQKQGFMDPSRVISPKRSHNTFFSFLFSHPSRLLRRIGRFWSQDGRGSQLPGYWQQQGSLFEIDQARRPALCEDKPEDTAWRIV